MKKGSERPRVPGTNANKRTDKIERISSMNGLSAYVLAADPTWLEYSVRAYYPHVEKIIVSYDMGGLGWTGAPIPVDECLSRLKAIDGDRKMRFVPGTFSRRDMAPMENDTFQRNTALQLASEKADWVLQLDTDEWIPHVKPLLDAITKAENEGLPAVEWPMRVLYRMLADGRFLEVCAGGGLDHFEYIAPIAVRAGTRLVHSRRTEGGFLRAVVKGDNRSLQLLRPCQQGEVRQEALESQHAIVHNSWAREPYEVARKLRSWSHASLRAWMYFGTTWLPSAWFWRVMTDLHPFFGAVWPALRICENALPRINSQGVCAPCTRDGAYLGEATM